MTRRSWIILGAAAATGLVVGLVVAVFERVAAQVLQDHVLEQPLWVVALAPTVGLTVATVVLAALGRGASPSTADEYIAAFHDPSRRLPLSLLPARLLAGAATIGSGAPMGLEGPSIYAGATVGGAVQLRLSRFFARTETRMLMVAGAAAGVAAIFKTPATGVLFALEVPYQNDLARRALLPSLVSSATSYLTFVSLIGTEPIFPVAGSAPGFDLTDLAGATALGLAAGLGARLYATVMLGAKLLAGRWPARIRVPAAGAALAALAVVGERLYGDTLTLGTGSRVLTWIVDPSNGLGLVALLFGLRMAGTAATLAGGGAGGLFIPLAVQGLLLGRFVAGVVDQPTAALFPVIGVAAFLGAGYRTPLASVMFVAESTGRAQFVVPALIAAATSQLAMGNRSVSPVQRATRGGHLERRLELPITQALSTDVLTVPPDATVSEFVWHHVLGRRQRSVPVVAENRYIGMCRLEQVAAIPRDAWETTPVADVCDPEVPVARPGWTIRDAVAAMEEAGVDEIPVCDSSGAFVGVLSSAEIVKLEEILEETSPDGRSS